jgi:hypothetical protein
MTSSDYANKFAGNDVDFTRTTKAGHKSSHMGVVVGFSATDVLVSARARFRGRPTTLTDRDTVLVAGAINIYRVDLGDLPSTPGQLDLSN